MKVLIWVSCFFVATILNTLLGYATGVKVGYLIFYFVVYFVAKKLCSKWDEHKEIKEYKKKIREDNQQFAENKIASNSSVVDVNQWQCSCGKVYPKNVSSCVCGKSKTDIINQSKSAEAFSKTDEILVEDIATTTDQIRFCRKCGNELLDNSKFCSKCGMEIISEQ